MEAAEVAEVARRSRPRWPPHRPIIPSSPSSTARPSPGGPARAESARPSRCRSTTPSPPATKIKLALLRVLAKTRARASGRSWSTPVAAGWVGCRLRPVCRPDRRCRGAQTVRHRRLRPEGSRPVGAAGLHLRCRARHLPRDGPDSRRQGRGRGLRRGSTQAGRGLCGARRHPAGPRVDRRSRPRYGHPAGRPRRAASCTTSASPMAPSWARRMPTSSRSTSGASSSTASSRPTSPRPRCRRARHAGSSWRPRPTWPAASPRATVPRATPSRRACSGSRTSCSSSTRTHCRVRGRPRQQAHRGVGVDGLA